MVQTAFSHPPSHLDRCFLGLDLFDKVPSPLVSESFPVEVSQAVRLSRALGREQAACPGVKFLAETFRVPFQCQKSPVGMALPAV